MLLFIFLCFVSGSYRFLEEDEKREMMAIEAEQESQVELWGRVDWVKKTQYGCAITLSQAELRRQDGSEMSDQINIYAYVSDAGMILPGDWILAEGVLKDFEQAHNPGEFDSLSYYRSLGFHSAMDIKVIKLVREASLPIYRYLIMLRESFRETFQRICTPEANGIYQAMLLGEKSELDAELKELYSSGGISHILAISGLHIAVIGMGLYRILRRFGGFKMSGFFAGGMMCLYVMLTGSGVSACRAGTMFVIQLVSFVCRRSYDMLSAVALALILILWDNPMYLFHSGCQLSFGAVLAIGMIYPIFVEVTQAKRSVYKAFLSSIAVSFVTFPILAWNFYEISPYSVILNLIVIPCMTFVMLSGILGGLAGLWHTHPIGLWTGRFFVALGQNILDLYEWLCESLKLIPGSRIVTGKPELWIIGVYYILLVAEVLFLQRKVDVETAVNKNRTDKNVLSLIGVLVIFTGLLCLRIQTGLFVCFIDVSQGDGIYIETPEHMKLLVDGGSTDKKNLYEDTLLPFLKSQGVSKLDYAIISHPDEDHVSGVKELLAEGDIRVKMLIMPEIRADMQDEAYLEVVELAKRSGAQVRFISEGDAMRYGKLHISCLYPYESLYTNDRNEYSTVLEVSYEDFDMLLTGDIGERAEQYIMEYLTKTGIETKYEVLKVAHHGSKDSSSEAFLEVVSPQIAVISCGVNNRYGHPHESVIKRLGDCGCKIMRTDLQGAITIEVEKEMRVYGHTE